MLLHLPIIHHFLLLSGSPLHRCFTAYFKLQIVMNKVTKNVCTSTYANLNFHLLWVNGSGLGGMYVRFIKNYRTICVCSFTDSLFNSTDSHNPFVKYHIVFFFKSLLNLLQYCFCFIFWVFGHDSCGLFIP